MKQRADIRLVELGLCESRSQAQRLIMAGQVRIGKDHLIQKPNEKVEAQVELRLDSPSPYVSRGAEKLRPALERFLPRLDNMTALDLGASTGGFTDLMLQRGARKVYAVDVGYGQLHGKLRKDPRVVSLERMNARDLTPQHIPETVNVLTADVSFISLRKILPVAAPFMKPGGIAFLLVKPQFEARRHEVKKGGVVRDPQVRQRCVNEVKECAVRQLQWDFLATIPSPIQGPKGNQEFICVFRIPPL